MAITVGRTEAEFTLSSRDLEAAVRLRERVLTSRSARGGWVHVRELLDDFDVDRLSASARVRLGRALAEVGLAIHPPLSNVARADSVVLSLDGASPNAAQPAVERETTTALTVREVLPGAPIRDTQLEHARVSRDKTLWFDVADSALVGVEELGATLRPFCNDELTDEMVSDLLSPDPRPKIRRFDGAVGLTAAFRAKAEESDDGVEDGSCTKAGVVVLEPVELLVGTDWLITAWHSAEVFRGASRIDERRPASTSALYGEVARCWPAQHLSNASDLATLILYELALTYAPTRRQLYVWLEEWELDFYRRPEKADADTLFEVRAAAAVLRDWLNPLNPAGMRDDMSRAWFPALSGTSEVGGYKQAVGVDQRIDKSLAGLTTLSDRVRSAFDLLQIRKTDQDRTRDESFQRVIAVGGGVILVPTLIAGVAGFNTWIPGKDSRAAFFIWIAVMVLLSVGAWVLIHRWQSRAERGKRDRKQR